MRSWKKSDRTELKPFAVSDSESASVLKTLENQWQRLRESNTFAEPSWGLNAYPIEEEVGTDRVSVRITRRASLAGNVILNGGECRLR